MPLNDNNCLPNLSCDQGITADYVNLLFAIPQTDNDDLDQGWAIVLACGPHRGHEC